MKTAEQLRAEARNQRRVNLNERLGAIEDLKRATVCFLAGALVAPIAPVAEVGAFIFAIRGAARLINTY